MKNNLGFSVYKPIKDLSIFGKVAFVGDLGPLRYRK